MQASLGEVEFYSRACILSANLADFQKRGSVRIGTGTIGERAGIGPSHVWERADVWHRRYIGRHILATLWLLLALRKHLHCWTHHRRRVEVTRRHSLERTH